MTSLLAKLGFGGSPAGSNADAGGRRRHRGIVEESLPLYSPVPPSELSPGRFDDDDDDDDDSRDYESEQLHQAQRRGGRDGGDEGGEMPPPSSSASPSLLDARFWADFTLGFADGLTVPFALTAGLSSLGQTDTVIYAGMAEICAGSISMGIGGYLSARGEEKAAVAAAAASAATAATESSADEAPRRGRRQERERHAAAETEKTDGKKAGEGLVAEYLAPLDLPPQLAELVLQHTRSRPEVGEVLRQRQEDRESSTGDGARDTTEEEEDPRRRTSPLYVGLSVSLGYLLGGLLPLFPYFFVGEVGDGLLWSFLVCAVALFVFGFCKDFCLAGSRAEGEGALDGEGDLEKGSGSSSGGGLMAGLRRPVTMTMTAGRQIPWADLRRSAWEGAQMVFLGSVAALAAVLCVRLFEGAKE